MTDGSHPVMASALSTSNAAADAALTESAILYMQVPGPYTKGCSILGLQPWRRCRCGPPTQPAETRAPFKCVRTLADRFTSLQPCPAQHILYFGVSNQTLEWSMKWASRAHYSGSGIY